MSASKITRRGLLTLVGFFIPMLSPAIAWNSISDLLLLDQRYVVDHFSMQVRSEKITVRVVRPHGIENSPFVILLPDKAKPSQELLKIAAFMVRNGLTAVIPDLSSALMAGTFNQSEFYKGNTTIKREEWLQLLLKRLLRRSENNGVIGVLAFGWGAMLTLPFLTDKEYLRGAVFFDFAVGNTALEKSLSVPVQMHISELDKDSLKQFYKNERRMLVRGIIFESYIYPAVDPGFIFNKGALRVATLSRLALERSLNFFKRTLTPK